MEDWAGGFLYRYRKWNEFTKKLLLDGEMYFSSFDDLNDPNEGKNIPDALIKDVLEKEVLPSADSDENRTHFEKIIKNFDTNPKIVSEYKKAIRDTIKEMGIVCLTTKPDNNPMWHFYADSDKGICIEFYFPRKYSRKYNHLCPCPINYNQIGHVTENLSELIVFTKDSDWSYESEFRLISRDLKDESSRIQKFPVEKMLCAVIAGHNMSNNDFNELRELIKKINNKYNLKVTVHKRMTRKYDPIDLESRDHWDNRHNGLEFIHSDKLE